LPKSQKDERYKLPAQRDCGVSLARPSRCIGKRDWSTDKVGHGIGEVKKNGCYLLLQKDGIFCQGIKGDIKGPVK